jgi:regulator of sirC expression with transglutaminase-like and TPR domain
LFIRLYELEGALADLNHLLDLKPDNVWAYLMRGMVYDEQGHIELAVQDYREFLALYTIEDEIRTTIQSRIQELE